MFNHYSILFVIGVTVVAAVSAQAASKQDPLRPPGYNNTETSKTVKKEVDAWIVNEILHSEGRRVAIVNNVAVKQGDLVNGAKVLDITADQVTLKFKDRIINARLGLVPVKKLKTNHAGR